MNYNVKGRDLVFQRGTVFGCGWVAWAPLLAAACGGMAPSGGAILDEAAAPSSAPQAAPLLDQSEGDLRASAEGRLADLGVSCRLWPAEGSTSQVEMTLENHGSVAVDLLRRGTAWDEASQVFSVRRDGRKVPYVGITAFRLPPDDAEFQRLSPGESAVVSYDLAQQHEIRDPGLYQVSLRSDLMHARVEGAHLVLQHDCGVLSAPLDPRASSEIGQARQPLVFDPGTGCGASEIALGNQMDEVARFATVTVSQDFQYYSTSIYERWFGAYDLNRAAFVFTSLNNINTSDAFDVFAADCYQNSGPPANLVCSGQTSIVAWVQYGNDTVHLCTPFFGGGPALVAQLGPGLASVLIHEKAHLIDDEMTSDIYGAAAAKALAQSDPFAATRNAENYAFFVADTYLTSFVLTPTLAPLL